MTCHSSPTLRISVFLCFVLLTGCAGKLETPERVYRHTDSSLTCAQIEDEADELMRRIVDLDGNISTERNANVSAWVAGQFFVVPMLGMDVSGNKEIQRNSKVKRAEHLRKLAIERNCRSSNG